MNSLNLMILIFYCLQNRRFTRVTYFYGGYGNASLGDKCSKNRESLRDSNHGNLEGRDALEKPNPPMVTWSKGRPEYICGTL